jgi:hypothetical protein
LLNTGQKVLPGFGFGLSRAAHNLFGNGNLASVKDHHLFFVPILEDGPTGFLDTTNSRRMIPGGFEIFLKWKEPGHVLTSRPWQSSYLT